MALELAIMVAVVVPETDDDAPDTDASVDLVLWDAMDWFISVWAGVGIAPLSRRGSSKICNLKSVAPELLCDTEVAQMMVVLMFHHQYQNLDQDRQRLLLLQQGASMNVRVCEHDLRARLCFQRKTWQLMRYLKGQQFHFLVLN